MSLQAQIQKFAQSIYLTIKNRYFDDIEGEDGQLFIAQVIDWTNMFVDELENEVGPDNQLVDWWFSRENGFSLGTAVEDETSIALPSSVDRLLTDEQRFVQIRQDGVPVSNWAVVRPGDIPNKSERVKQDMCAVVGTNLVFSRAFKDTEQDGEIVGDVVKALPELSATNVNLFKIVRPKQLLILGVAKNATLPDIVQGGLSPSYVQKYGNLLNGAMLRSRATSMSGTVQRDDYGGIGGVY